MGERTEKTCRGCGETKAIDEFLETWNNQRERYYRSSRCHECRKAKKREAWHSKTDEIAAARRARYANDPEYRRRLLSAQHKSRHGISLDEKEALLASQGGRCANAGCGTTEPGGHGWTTDHDHACCPGVGSCGECIRGILCNACNFALGHVADDIARLHGLIEYLTQWGDTSNQLEETA